IGMKFSDPLNWPFGHLNREIFAAGIAAPVESTTTAERLLARICCSTINSLPCARRLAGLKSAAPANTQAKTCFVLNATPPPSPECRVCQQIGAVSHDTHFPTDMHEKRDFRQ